MVRTFILCSVLAATVSPVAAEPVRVVTLPQLTEPSFAPVKQLTDAFGLDVLGPMLEQAVRFQLAIRDAAHVAVDSLARRLDTLAERTGVVIPDLTVLTTEPVANSESSGFGWRDDPIRHTRKFHSGADLRGKRGTPVVAAGDGVVKFCGRRGGYGNIIYIDHGGGVVTSYAHLQRIRVKPDTVVVAGQRIGDVGSTGRTTGPHLHFEIRLDGRPVDPVAAMVVASLARESPLLGHIAAFALSPELQAEVSSRVDPPRQNAPAKREQRPDRPGRIVRPKPVS